MAQARGGKVSHISQRGTDNRAVKRARTGAVYQYDNTARKLAEGPQRKPEGQRTTKQQEQQGRQRGRVQHMQLGYVAFLMVTMFACGILLAYYVQLQSALITKREAVTSLERKLNTLRVANDEEWYRITSSIDLEEIKGVAIGELGMTYAQEGQIIPYSSEGNDYMRKVAEDAN